MKYGGGEERRAEKEGNGGGGGGGQTLSRTSNFSPWNFPLSLTEKTRTTLRAERNAAFSFFSLTGSVDHTP